MHECMAYTTFYQPCELTFAQTLDGPYKVRVLKGVNEDVIYDAVEFNNLTDQLNELANECSMLREVNVNSITPLLDEARKCKKLTMDIRNVMSQSCIPVGASCVPGFTSKV